MMALETVKIGHGDVTAEVVPERGALVSSLRVHGREVLYLDRTTLKDASKNVRGGIPVLFPFASRLVDEIFVPAGTKMKQHGFARNKAWRVVEKRTDAVRAALMQDAYTAAHYPYQYEAEQTAMIVPHGLHLELLVTNKGAKPLPVSPGWHPYFQCAAAKKHSVTSNVPGLAPDKLTNEHVFDFGLVAPVAGRADFQIPRMGTMRLSFSPEMRHLQFWSEPGKYFICIEPFQGPPNTINTPQRCDIPPGQAHCFWMRIEVL
jgi:galactose mutarotase-like enzyme